MAIINKNSFKDIEFKMNLKLIIASGISFLIIVGLMSSCETIHPGNVGVMFNRMSGALYNDKQGYVMVMPFVTTVQEYPVSLRTYSMVKRSQEGSSKEDDSIDLPTKEGQHIKQDISITYNTSEDRATQVFKSFNGAGMELIEGSFIRRTIITAAQNQSGQMFLAEVISSGRDKLQKAISTVLAEEFNKMGFQLDKVNLGASHLPQAIEAQMQQKMAAQQTALQAEYELQKQEALAKAKVAEAEGTAKATFIQAQAQAKSNAALTSSLTAQLIQYETIQKWNGQLPTYTGGAIPFIKMP